MPIFRAHDCLRVLKLRSIVSARLPLRLRGPESLASDLAFDYSSGQLRADLSGSIVTHAHQPRASVRQSLQSRNSYAMLATMAIDLRHGHREIQRPARFQRYAPSLQAGAFPRLSVIGACERNAGDAQTLAGCGRPRSRIRTNNFRLVGKSRADRGHLAWLTVVWSVKSVSVLADFECRRFHVHQFGWFLVAKRP